MPPKDRWVTVESWLVLEKSNVPACTPRLPLGSLPDWTISVSSCSSDCSDRTIASNDSQFRAAFPDPPYTTSSSGRSATSGSRLFISIRIAASCGQPLQVSAVPRGERIVRVAVAMKDASAKDRP